jgi:hypothetical protein
MLDNVRLLMSLEYLRKYRAYFYLSKSYRLSENPGYRNRRWEEDVLIKSKNFSLPRKKVILTDATESFIESLKK